MELVVDANVWLSAAGPREPAHLAARLFLRGADAQYAALALERGVPLITLDRELCLRAAGTLDCLTPEAWISQKR